ncbi:MAG TPA: Glu/Leu/Phe/Val dehydrogenase dimerization domain-containing protein [Parachlamydiaceae bacterium]|nr:Glu/Leu/Phe/Val dehydrogenase dimerization domain-containing protein [Parachlamydiaceae bacterium]
MLKIKEIAVPGYEKIVEAHDEETGLHSFIALHNTSLGPALGGSRIYPYKTREKALEDVLRLSKAMTYKAALAKTGTGGGKSVIIGDPSNIKTKKFLHSFGEAVNYLKGHYIVAEDVGTTADDMLIIHEVTPYVSALPTEKSSGDPSRFTAFGVYLAMQALAIKLFGSPSLKGKTILIQGLGSVGSKLANLLFFEEANLIIDEVDLEKAKKEAILYGAKYLENNSFFNVECDIFSPCALGGILKEETIPFLKCKGIAGSANNQLLNDETAKLLKEKNILYAPDFVANAGGLMNATTEFEPLGYHAKVAREKLNYIFKTMMEIFDASKKSHKTTVEIANELAEYNLKHQIGKRLTPIQFF